MLFRTLAFASLLLLSAVAHGEVLAFPDDGERLGLPAGLTGSDPPWETSDTVEWYVTWAGAAFTESGIERGEFETLESAVNRLGWGRLPDAFPARPHPSYAVALGYRMRLADEPGNPRDVFGWQFLEYDSTHSVFVGIVNYPLLFVVDSAAVIGKEGIIVGTQTAIPEPTGLVLLAIGLIAPLSHRRSGR